MLDFERTFSLSRFGKQMADNFVHCATQSKMTVFKTTPLIQGDGQGRFFGCAGVCSFLSAPEGVVNSNEARRCMSDFGHCFGDWANWGSLFW